MLLIPHSNNSQSIRDGWFVISFIYVAVKIAKANPYVGGWDEGVKNKEVRVSEIVLLFHTPTIVKALGMVGL